MYIWYRNIKIVNHADYENMMCYIRRLEMHYTVKISPNMKVIQENFKDNGKIHKYLYKEYEVRIYCLNLYINWFLNRSWNKIN